MGIASMISLEKNISATNSGDGYFNFAFFGRSIVADIDKHAEDMWEIRNSNWGDFVCLCKS